MNLSRCKLGDYVIVGANNVVRRGNIPDNSIVIGITVKVVKRYDSLNRSWK